MSATNKKILSYLEALSKLEVALAAGFRSFPLSTNTAQFLPILTELDLSPPFKFRSFFGWQ